MDSEAEIWEAEEEDPFKAVDWLPGMGYSIMLELGLIEESDDKKKFYVDVLLDEIMAYLSAFTLTDQEHLCRTYRRSGPPGVFELLGFHAAAAKYYQKRKADLYFGDNPDKDLYVQGVKAFLRKIYPMIEEANREWVEDFKLNLRIICEAGRGNEAGTTLAM